jgi:hypothetical protein
LLAGAGVARILSIAGPDRAGVPNLLSAVPVVVLVGWSFIGGGLLYWRSRPDNHLWAVLIIQGLAWFASMLPDSHNPALFTFGEAAYPLQYASTLGCRRVISGEASRLAEVGASTLVTGSQRAIYWESRPRARPDRAMRS